MIAMQYCITLPTDYDMAIIRRRIADKGHLLDDFPGLVFKAYQYAERGDQALSCRDNLYAPFYVWHDADAMNRFLCGPGFAALARDFGRPVVRSWPVWGMQTVDDLRGAASADLQKLPISDGAELESLRATEAEAARAAATDGALAAVSAFDPVDWTRLRFRLWPDLRAGDAGDAALACRVGHVSQPGTRN